MKSILAPRNAEELANDVGVSRDEKSGEKGCNGQTRELNAPFQVLALGDAAEGTFDKLTSKEKNTGSHSPCLKSNNEMRLRFSALHDASLLVPNLGSILLAMKDDQLALAEPQLAPNT